MKTKMTIKNIIMIAVICISSLFFINMSFAANTAKITVETANLREEPSSNAKILELASQGDTVEVIEKSGDWYKVKYKNITGYLRADLIDVKEETSNNNKVEENTTSSEETNIENTTNNEQENQKQNETMAEVQTTEKIGKYTIAKATNIKITPLINALEIGKMEQEKEVEVTEIINNWAHLTSENNQGWTRIENLTKIENNNSTDIKQEEKEPEVQKQEETNNNNSTTDTATTQSTKMYVNTQTVNLREKADKTAKVLVQLEANTQVTVISKNNGWCNVEVNGKTGYVAESLLSAEKQQTSRSGLTRTETTTETKQESNDSNNTSTATSKSGSQVVTYAQTLSGCKYVYGGTSTSGFDCSGFTQYVYKHFGITLNRTAASQYSNGSSVTDLQAGDLVMFGKSGINHVGIYIGGNSFIHAANPSRGVTTDTLASGYYKINYVGARRIF